MHVRPRVRHTAVLLRDLVLFPSCRGTQHHGSAQTIFRPVGDGWKHRVKAIIIDTLSSHWTVYTWDDGWCVTVWPCGIRDNFASLIVPRSETKLTLVYYSLVSYFPPLAPQFVFYLLLKAWFNWSVQHLCYGKRHRRVQPPVCLLLPSLPASLSHVYYDKNVIHSCRSVLCRHS